MAPKSEIFKLFSSFIFSCVTWPRRKWIIKNASKTTFSGVYTKAWWFISSSSPTSNKINSQRPALGPTVKQHYCSAQLGRFEGKDVVRDTLSTQVNLSHRKQIKIFLHQMKTSLTCAPWLDHSKTTWNIIYWTSESVPSPRKKPLNTTLGQCWAPTIPVYHNFIRSQWFGGGFLFGFSFDAARFAAEGEVLWWTQHLLLWSPLHWEINQKGRRDGPVQIAQLWRFLLHNSNKIKTSSETFPNPLLHPEGSLS